MREIIPVKKYRHFKDTIITVIALAQDSETLEEKVVYEHNDKIWVRDKKCFYRKLIKKYPNIEQLYCFEEI